MLTGFYTGVSGIHFNTEKLNVISNNIANVDTAGFRRSVMMMKTRESEPKTALIDSRVRRRIPSFHGVVREQILTTKEGAATKKYTGNDFDLAIDPSLNNAFFKVKAPYLKEPAYTRNGTLSIALEDPKDPSSQPVLYMAGKVLLDDAGNAIAIDPSLGEPQVTSNGDLVQDGIAVAQIPIYRFNKYESLDQLVDSDIELLNNLGGSLYTVPKSMEYEFNPIRIQVGEAGAPSTLINQGYAESSNVNVVTELTAMMEAEKSTKANQLAANMHMSGLEKLFQVMRNG